MFLYLLILQILQTTGLTGLAVAANAHHTLGALYGKILRTLQKMPETAVYRVYTEQIVRDRAAVLKQVIFVNMFTFCKKKMCKHITGVIHSC